MSSLRLLLPTVLLLVPAPLLAQAPDLKLPTALVGAAAAADWASTYHGLKHYELYETNPLLRPLSRSPGKLVTLGALIDVGGVTAWNVTVGRKHPRLAAAGLWGMVAFRTYLALHNLRNQRKAARRDEPRRLPDERQTAAVRARRE
jgi:hypothetical protein